MGDCAQFVSFGCMSLVMVRRHSDLELDNPVKRDLQRMVAGTRRIAGLPVACRFGVIRTVY